MRSGSVFLPTARLLVVVLLSVLLLPLAPMQGSPAVAAWPDASSSPDQQVLDAQPQAPVSRPLDPAIVLGSQIPGFYGAPLGDLFVYAFDGTTWTQVPFQFDEVDATDTYVQFEDGLLDANDELVFMAADLGVEAELYEWPADADSRNYSRYKLRVTNPLEAAEEGWVYLYRSATMAISFAPYITWNPGTSSMVATTYTIIYDLPNHYGMDSFYLNAQPVDVVDRAKLRLRGRCLQEGEWQDFAVNEDSDEVKDEFEPPNVIGPVRVGRGTVTDRTWSYASMYENVAKFDAGYAPEDCEEIQYLTFRFSEDWLNPATSGMAPMTYYDSNMPGGVPVDGNYDPIPREPPAEWRQVSGARGSIVQVVDITPSGGPFEEVINYYKDNWEEDPEDSGDKVAYGDAGWQVNNPIGVVLLSFATYVLDPLQPNLGPTYDLYRHNPLQTTATAEAFEDCTASGVHVVWSPKPVYPDVETAFTATVGGGLEPFTFDWTFGDGGGEVAGNPVNHTFTEPGAFPVTLTVTNECGVTEVVKHVMVWDPEGDQYYIFLPVVMR